MQRGGDPRARHDHGGYLRQARLPLRQGSPVREGARPAPPPAPRPPRFRVGDPTRPALLGTVTAESLRLPGGRAPDPCQSGFQVQPPDFRVAQHAHVTPARELILADAAADPAALT